MIFESLVERILNEVNTGPGTQQGGNATYSAPAATPATAPATTTTAPATTTTAPATTTTAPATNTAQPASVTPDQWNKVADKLEQNAKNHAPNSIAGTPEVLLDTYFTDAGNRWKGKFAGGATAKARQDSITAKYTDAGFDFLNLAKHDIGENNFAGINKFKALRDLITNNIAKLSKEAFQSISEFTTTNIDQYQCKDVTLKGISDTDRLSEIALQTLNNFTVFNAVSEMLKKRAGITKMNPNFNMLKEVLINPLKYISGTTALPEVFTNTLADNGLYVKQLLEVGVSAITYFRFLQNKKQTAVAAQQHPSSASTTPTAPTVQTSSLEALVGDILNETQQASVKPLSKQETVEYTNWLVQGKSNLVPILPDNKAYTVGEISNDKSAQAQDLKAKLEAIAHFIKTKKSGGRLGQAANLASAVAGFGGAKLYG